MFDLEVWWVTDLTSRPPREDVASTSRRNPGAVTGLPLGLASPGRTFAGADDVRDAQLITSLAVGPRGTWAAHLVRGATWTPTGSNRRPPGCKPGALPTELDVRDPPGQLPGAGFWLDAVRFHPESWARLLPLRVNPTGRPSTRDAAR